MGRASALFLSLCDQQHGIDGVYTASFEAGGNEVTSTVGIRLLCLLHKRRIFLDRCKSSRSTIIPEFSLLRSDLL
jgi:hypothetical protein